ncbi:MAG TPA: hypothetical protein VE715_11155 [Blastocatellia bacterium]|nr:hypothetical protein [Blastocatellia bacterium]
MNCSDFETIIIEMARDRLMDASARERGLDHIRRCASCAALLGAERALSCDLRELSAEGAAEEIPDRIETALLAAFRQQSAAPAPATISAIRNRRRSLAVAALALLTFGLPLAGLAVWMAPSATPESPERSSVDGGVASTPAVAPTPEKTPEKSSPPSPPIVAERQSGRSILSSRSEKRRKRLAAAPHNHRPANDIAQREFVTQFFPVMQGGELIPLDGGRIVRVRMPRSNLIPLGIPFNQERVNETIKADVLLSNDGLARAIRLVY